jgi:flagellar biosynthesis/type III secretory pathway protein FliH
MQTNEKEDAIRSLEKAKEKGYKDGFEKGLQLAFETMIAYFKERINCMKEDDEDAGSKTD